MGSERPPVDPGTGGLASHALADAATERAAVVALTRLGPAAPAEWAERVEREGSALTVLRQALEPADGQVSLLPVDSEAGLDRARVDIDAWEDAGFRLMTLLDRDYPVNLREVHDRPPLVFVAGRLEAGDERAIAVIGSRQASETGLQTTARIARGLTARGIVVVSGLARGVDTAAHTAALAAGGRTLAVIGTGLARCYPPENAELQARLARECAVVSQFWPDAPPSRRSFPMRNAVMSGMTRATVVVEASARSGARVQARQALAQGRPVFLLTGVLVEDWAQELARRPGVHVVDDAAQIVAVVERADATDTLVE